MLKVFKPAEILPIWVFNKTLNHRLIAHVEAVFEVVQPNHQTRRNPRTADFRINQAVAMIKNGPVDFDNELLLKLKRSWSDGTSHILLSPIALLGRLAALVPPKGFNSVRYHGVLAPRSNLRDLVIPSHPEPDEIGPGPQVPAEPVTSARPRRIPWPDLMKHVFKVDIDRCQCGGKLKLVAFVTDPCEARRYLEHVGLPSTVPNIAPARAPPQVEFAYQRIA